MSAHLRDKLITFLSIFALLAFFSIITSFNVNHQYETFQLKFKNPLTEEKIRSLLEEYTKREDTEIVSSENLTLHLTCFKKWSSIYLIHFSINSHAVGIMYYLRCRYGRWAAILFFYFRLHFVGCTSSFDLASEKLSHVWARLILDNLKIIARFELTRKVNRPRIQPLSQLCSWTFFCC